jgi:hypothetical protein
MPGNKYSVVSAENAGFMDRFAGNSAERMVDGESVSGYEVGSGLDNIGQVINAGSQLFGMYGTYRGYKNAAESNRLNRENMQTKHQFGIADVMSQIASKNRIRDFMGGTSADHASINDYLPQSTLEKYGMGQYGNNTTSSPSALPPANPSSSGSYMQMPSTGNTPMSSAGRTTSNYGSLVPPANPANSNTSMNSYTNPRRQGV